MPDRLDVQFTSGDALCAAWLLLPNSDTPAPVIVMAHGLGAVREMRLDAYAERFQAAGYACLVFDYRHFGASGGEPRQLVGIPSQLADWASAISYARNRDGIDGTRVILWGTSLAAGHVIVASALDGGIDAVVAQCPFTDGIASALVTNPLTLVKVTARALHDVVGARFGRPPVMVPSAGAPGSTALMATPDAQSGYLDLVPAGAPFRNEVAARFVFQIIKYRPGRYASKVQCPILFNICERDSLGPAKTTQRYARSAPYGEIRLYPQGHFDIYVGEPFERVVADQIAFLTHNVPSARSAQERNDASL